jgi:hypothetical protein
MTEHTDQATPQPGAVPARIDLDDFIEAVMRGVARAAEEEVSGYRQFGGAAAPFPGTFAPLFIGVHNPPPPPPPPTKGGVA